MSFHDVEKASTTAGLPLSAGLAPLIENAAVEKHPRALDARSLLICALCMAVAAVVTVVARLLVSLIGFVTNLAFYGRISGDLVSPAGHHLGLWVVLVPIVGSVIVGFMAKYGAKAIRGHGIPEAMEQILTNESRIPVRMTFLKPLSAAISIGTGGPFGAEGPIIATGGALGSLFGQFIHVSAHERKVLLAAGAAGGMTAIFATPFAAVLLAIELLVFEFRPRSFVPLILSVLVAMAMRPLLFGVAPVFNVPILPPATPDMLMTYALEGLALGVFSILMTKSVYHIEDLFEKLPIHWMWWPAIGGLVVGIIGFIAPNTMGVGYDNIDRILSGQFVGTALGVFCLLKFVSWSVALGSGTSGGTLAPIFTIGGALGVLLGQGLGAIGLAVDLRMAALVGMAASFAGASRALFASILFAMEITGQFNTLLPLITGCVAAFLVSAFAMKTTIMTEKLSRRGTHVPGEYVPASAPHR
ncbi:chloride channel protein [Allorhizobium terrae]|uniref:Chloride channel protein n=1 Tax=Allorhizobium terrae TaxID=1848972 RepID=A0A4S3ZV34_9HYPH|nr:chloride channel protein [Allorhizobium terrae]THF49625.1 chloride channel protein [Allorhizobium terrae]